MSHVGPLSGGAAENDVPVRMDEHGCVGRAQVALDLLRIRPASGYSFPIHCPACVQHGTMHVFDFILREPEGRAFWALCLHCNGEYQLANAVDRTQGISISPPIRLKPPTVQNDERTDSSTTTGD